MQHKLRFKDIINLASPPTWTASVMPCVLAVVIAYQKTGSIQVDMMICLFLIAVLMQSSVNTLNDYSDFIKGTDTLDNSPDASDAVIVHGLNPSTAKKLGYAFLIAAFIPGIYTVIRCGFVPLIIGAIGALIVICYSNGKLPISYLPIGELVSGFVMGGLIPLAGVYMQTGKLDFFVLIQALPVIIGIAMIMFSNNSCDIERDMKAGRRTLPCVIGREKTAILYRTVLIIWVLSPVILFAATGKYISLLVYVLASLVFLHIFIRQVSTPLNEKTREMIMAGISILGMGMEFAYFVAMLIFI